MRKKETEKQIILNKVLALLEKNSRLRNKEIAKSIGISEKSVKKYIDDLIKSGRIIGFTIVPGRKNNISAFVHINAMKGVSTSALCKQLLSIGFCDQVSELSGEYDIICRISADSIDVLNQRIDQIRNMKGVEKTRSFIVLRSWN